MKVAEILSGTAGLAKAVAQLGVAAEAWDVADGPDADLLQKPPRRRLGKSIRRREFGFMWIGFPCGTLSTARRGKGGPGALRTRQFLYGVPGLA